MIPVGQFKPGGSRRFEGIPHGGGLHQRIHVATAPVWCCALLLCFLCTGCYVPLRSPGIPAAQLPDFFRTPLRSTASQLNLAQLTVLPPQEYLLGPGDTLNLLVPGFFESGQVVPMSAQVSADGTVTLPLAGAVHVSGMNVASAQKAVAQAYAHGILRNPAVNLSLSDKAKTEVTVIGDVVSPGVYELSRYEEDLARAIAAAQGLKATAAEVIEIHRRVTPQDWEALKPTYPPITRRLPHPECARLPMPPAHVQEKMVLRIPLRGSCPTIALAGHVEIPKPLTPNDVRLRPGDVVFVPRRQDEVFFVVGPLSRTNVVNFSVRDRDRQLGNAFLLPIDRDIDVLTAVAMAGYIDPIESPSTVTLHRAQLAQPPLLVRVDLIKARYDWRENLYVQPGDIIYLNPDGPWWFRRTFDRVLPDLITLPYAEAMARWINPFPGS